jgi:hypothetical protein
MNKPITPKKFATDLWGMMQMAIDEAVAAEREACGEAAMKAAEKAIAVAIKLEREACAKVCETLWDTPTNGMATEEKAYGDECAAAIRARGQE